MAQSKLFNTNITYWHTSIKIINDYDNNDNEEQDESNCLPFYLHMVHGFL